MPDQIPSVAAVTGRPSTSKVVRFPETSFRVPRNARRFRTVDSVEEAKELVEATKLLKVQSDRLRAGTAKSKKLKRIAR